MNHNFLDSNKPTEIALQITSNIVIDADLCVNNIFNDIIEKINLNIDNIAIIANDNIKFNFIYNQNYFIKGKNKIVYNIKYNNTNLILKIFKDNYNQSNLIDKYYSDKNLLNQYSYFIPEIYFFGKIDVFNHKFNYIIMKKYNTFNVSNITNELNIYLSSNLRKIIQLVKIIKNLPYDNNKKYIIPDLKLDNIGFDDNDKIILIDYNKNSIVNKHTTDIESSFININYDENTNNNYNILHIGLIICELFFNNIFQILISKNPFKLFFINDNQLNLIIESFIYKQYNSQTIKKILDICFNEDDNKKQIFIPKSYIGKKHMLTYDEIMQELLDIIFDLDIINLKIMSTYDEIIELLTKIIADIDVI